MGNANCPWLRYNPYGLEKKYLGQYYWTMIESNMDDSDMLELVKDNANEILNNSQKRKPHSMKCLRRKYHRCVAYITLLRRYEEIYHIPETWHTIIEKLPNGPEDRPNLQMKWKLLVAELQKVVGIISPLNPAQNA